MAKLARSFMMDNSGATSIEYALIASGIALVIITAITNLGAGVAGKFSAVSTALK